jgi:hypothetical protein
VINPEDEGYQDAEDRALLTAATAACRQNPRDVNTPTRLDPARLRAAGLDEVAALAELAASQGWELAGPGAGYDGRQQWAIFPLPGNPDWYPGVDPAEDFPAGSWPNRAELRAWLDGERWITDPNADMPEAQALHCMDRRAWAPCPDAGTASTRLAEHLAQGHADDHVDTFACGVGG